jgi:hypothetical protein
MEIRKYTDIVGGVATTAIPEGRMCIMTSNLSHSKDFGSETDLPGFRMPQTAAEATKAKFVVTWPVNNSNFEGAIKMFVSVPSFSYALRAGGWDQAANVPFTGTAYLTYPGNQDGVTIPSGFQVLAFDRGVFRVPSGSYVYNAAMLVPGCALEALNVADDGASEAGKLNYDSGGTATVAVVEQLHSNFDLTFRTL